jgi:hypothetical protein
MALGEIFQYAFGGKRGRVEFFFPLKNFMLPQNGTDDGRGADIFRYGDSGVNGKGEPRTLIGRANRIVMPAGCHDVVEARVDSGTTRAIASEQCGGADGAA